MEVELDSPGRRACGRSIPARRSRGPAASCPAIRAARQRPHPRTCQYWRLSCSVVNNSAPNAVARTSAVRPILIALWLIDKDFAENVLAQDNPNSNSAGFARRAAPDAVKPPGGARQRNRCGSDSRRRGRTQHSPGIEAGCARTARPVLSTLSPIIDHRRVKIVTTVRRRRRPRFLRVEPPSLHVLVGEPRRETSRAQPGARAAGNQLAQRMLRGMDDDPGNDFRRIDRRLRRGSTPRYVFAFSEEGRVDARRFDERHRDWGAPSSSSIRSVSVNAFNACLAAQ